MQLNCHKRPWLDFCDVLHKTTREMSISEIEGSTDVQEYCLVPGFVGPTNCRTFSETAEIRGDRSQSPDLDRSVKPWTPAHRAACENTLGSGAAGIVYGICKLRLEFC